MSTTDETGATGSGGEPSPSRGSGGWQRAARRYGPFAAIAVVVAVVAIAFGGGDGGDEGVDSGAGDGATSREELILSGPMTPERAELEGVEDVDFGPNCDPETGRIKLPTVYAPPCVEPFEGDNGGATSQGVTGDTVKVVYYQPDPALDPLATATVAGAGADVSPESARRTVQGFVDLYNDIYETYGRTVEVEVFVGTGAGDDEAAARNDAIAIAEKEPFAVLNGPTQTSRVFAAELASRGIICGPSCSLALPEDIVEEYAPLLWQTGPTPNQSVALAAEMIGKLAGPGTNAELAGDPAMHDQERVYGLLHYDTPDGDHRPVIEDFTERLEEQGVELATDVEFTLDLAQAQENARTIISRLKDAGVTTVLYYGDPLTPSSLTEEATAQDYRPEWILGPSVLMDTTIFARLTDGEQWQNGFGLSLVAARGERSTDGAFQIYEWAYGEPPPNNTANVINPRLRNLFNGVHLAGPELTPETFRDAMFRYPVSGGGPTEAQISRGDHGVWPEMDWGGTDDATLIWWDPEASGEDEVGNEGEGMYRYANGGERYTLGNFPGSLEESGLFDVESSVTVFEEVPPEDQAPDYPSPNLTPP
ncbi:MAG TPA: ABC transporter substrate-binding protein [Acidimicrobiales bacterium]